MVVVVLYLFTLDLPAPGQDSPSLSRHGQPLKPFLEVFQAKKEPAVIGKSVTLVSALGDLRGYAARQETPERLPALLLVNGDDSITEWMKQNARDLASLGYVTLAVELPRVKSGPSIARTEAAKILRDEQTLAGLSAAVRWLRRRPDVLPERIGVVGWAGGGEQALALAAAISVQACVLCDCQVPDDLTALTGLRGTPLLGIFPAGDAAVRARLPVFRKSLTDAGSAAQIRVPSGVRVGFMRPPANSPATAKAADEAYVELYEFLGKHVEDAALNERVPKSSSVNRSIATIADLMQAVNQPAGVRGSLAKALENQPIDEQAWKKVRANGALLAEAGNLLRGKTPPRGTRLGWEAQVETYTSAANKIRAAASLHDYPAAQRGMQELAATCAACHREHR